MARKEHPVKDNENKNGKKTAFAVSLIVFILVLIGAAIYLAKCTTVLNNVFGETKPEGADRVESMADESSKETETENGDDGKTEVKLPENPVNFSKQMDINKEIYAWIYIPNTNVNYPILQHRGEGEEADLYYNRRGLDENYYLNGSIFTQQKNNRDFSDPVTLIYGHNMTEDGTMFATIHNFEDADFFEKNEYFYIYLPGHILTYYVVSAYKYSNRHIINTFNFEDPKVLREYFDFVMNPMTIPMNVREGYTIADDAKLVVLSTCMADNNYRYLVNGVLIKDERTK